MNPAYRDILAARVAGVVAEAKAAASVTHATTKGTFREILIRGLLRPLLSSDIGVGHGQVASWTGDLSPQQDVILYDRRIIPPITYDLNIGIFPCEGVLATIEVKSKLTAATLKEAVDNVKDLSSLAYLNPDPDLPPEALQEVEKIASCLFAFDTDLSGDRLSEIDRITSAYGEDVPLIRALCVAGRTCAVWDKPGQRWHTFPVEQPEDHVLIFVVKILQTFARIGLSRGRPDFTNYLF